MNEPVNYEKIRERIEKRYKDRNELIIHAIVFVAINALLVLSSMREGNNEAIGPVFTIWGFFLLLHALVYWSRHGSWAKRREEAIQREVQAEIERIGYQKPKRDVMRLTDDGEIEPLEENDVLADEPYLKR